MLKRELEPHVEFTIECLFLGPTGDIWLAEVSLIAHNVGNVIQRFSRIHLRIRGIATDAPLNRWPGYGDRVEFGEKIAEERNITPKSKDGKPIEYFTEPGVKQAFTYITTVPVRFRFVLVFAEFDYVGCDGRTHDCERVFELRLPNEDADQDSPR